MDAVPTLSVERRVASSDDVRERLYYVDGLRGLAILLVVLCSAFAAAPAAFAGAPLIMRGILGQLNHAVDLFFIISGLCLAYPALLVERADGLVRFDLARYLVRRIVRIVPSYYAAIAVLLAIGVIAARLGHVLHGPLGAPPSALDVVKQVLFLDGGTTFVNPQFWTLPVEVRWYAVFPVALIVWLRPPRAFGLLVFAIATGAAFTRASSFDLVLLPAFLLGIVAADLRVRPIRIQRLTLGLTLGTALGLVVATVSNIGFLIEPLWQLMLFSGVVAIGTFPFAERLLANRALGFVGSASYAIFLVHQPVLAAVEGALPRSFNAPLALAIAVFASLAAGVGFWAIVDAPFASPAKRRAAAAAGANLVGRLLRSVGIPTAIELAPGSNSSALAMAPVTVSAAEGPPAISATQLTPPLQNVSDTTDTTRLAEIARKAATEKQAREEAERKAATEKQAREEAERKAAEQRARDEAARKAATEKQAREEAERKAAEQRAREEAARKAAAEKQAREEAVRKAAAEKQAREEAVRKAAEQRAREEAARKAAAEKQAREEAERKAAEQRARQEAERKAAEQRAREEAERKAAEQRARQEAERKAAVEKRVREEAERVAAEERAQAEAERRLAERRARENAEREALEQIARAEAERIAAERAAYEEEQRQAAEKRSRAEADRLANELGLREEAERRASEARAREEVERLAAERHAREEADRKAAEQRTREEAERTAAEQHAREERERSAAAERALQETERAAAEQRALQLAEMEKARKRVAVEWQEAQERAAALRAAAAAQEAARERDAFTRPRRGQRFPLFGFRRAPEPEPDPADQVSVADRISRDFGIVVAESKAEPAPLPETEETPAS